MKCKTFTAMKTSKLTAKYSNNNSSPSQKDGSSEKSCCLQRIILINIYKCSV